MILPDDLLGPVEKLAQNLFISAPTPNQLAAVSAFDCEAELDRHVARYAANRDILLQGLPSAITETAAPCQGRFICLPISLSSVTAHLILLHVCWQSRALQPHQALILIRSMVTAICVLSFAGSTADMHQAVSRFNNFITSLKVDAA